MAVNKKRKSKERKKALGEEGQALIEFILFFPFLLMMYSVTLSIANSINASINQQKVTRAYFYYRLQNNSTAPTPFRQEGNTAWWRSSGQHINLWGERQIGDQPLAACFKFNVPLGVDQEDSCETSYQNRATQFIRVGTVYGVCGATYLNAQGNVLRLPNGLVKGQGASPETVVGPGNCLIQ